MKNALIAFALILNTLFSAVAANPDSLWRGSMTPYDLAVTPEALPDTLEPIGVVHIARHGARYMTSPNKVNAIRERLEKATERGTVTDSGRAFMQLLARIDSLTGNRWGLLDSVGYKEERALAGQLREEMGEALRKGSVEAWSTYVPRAIMSMYAYTYRLAMLSPYLNIQTHEGPRQDPLLRFFDTDSTYTAYLADGDWREIYDSFEQHHVPIRPAEALVGTAAGYSDSELRHITMEAYAVLRSLDAMGITFNPAPYFSREELMECWRASNLKHYLCRSASRLTDIPARSAEPLLRAVIEDVDRVSNPWQPMRGIFYFAHAETLMPLFSLMNLPGCNAPDADYEHVSNVWRDSDIVPLAANLDVEVWLGSSGTLLISTVLNGRRIPPLDDGQLLVAWSKIRAAWLAACN